ncbi:ATP-binding protein [Streptosporangium algeriense]|uniref:ATP-binding protein n=1 Tax=Streptosporangium algeriense TaxID=1682748 RepID=A0ABW3DNZ4_9ACTN
MSGIKLGAIILPGLERSAGIARQYVTALLARAGYTAVHMQDVVLLVSEVVTNAVVHTASSDPGGKVTIKVALDGNRVYVEVTDDGSNEVPMPRAPDDLGTGGRGLWLVEALSDSWGARMEQGSTSVWMYVSLVKDGEGGCSFR